MKPTIYKLAVADSFVVASDQAKDFAARYGEPIALERSHNGWIVLASIDVLEKIKSEEQSRCYRVAIADVYAAHAAEEENELNGMRVDWDEYCKQEMVRPVFGNDWKLLEGD